MCFKFKFASNFKHTVSHILPPHEGEMETTEPTFVSLLFPCFRFTFECFAQCFFLGDKSLTFTNKHNS